MNTKKKNSWGLEPGNIDPSIRPQDDFYKYVNNNWKKKNPIPPTESRWGGFVMLRYETEQQLRAIVEELSSKKSCSAGSAEQMIQDFYNAGMNVELREKLGTTPLSPLLSQIAKIKNSEQVLQTIHAFHAKGIDLVWDAALDQDAKKSDRYIFYIGQGGLSLPDRDYYLKNDSESVRVRTAFIAHVKKVFALLGRSKNEANTAAETIMTIETRLAHASMTKEDMRDLEKMYHKKTISQLTKHTPKLEWKQYLKKIGAPTISEAILMQPNFFSEVEKMLTEIPVELWKTYFEFHVVDGFAHLLSSDFVKEDFSFYSKTMTGNKKMKPLWRSVLSLTNGSLGELLGKIYVKKHFSPEAKKRVNEIINDLFTAYEARIKTLDWMSATTKKKALLKLSQIQRKIGYPDVWKKYTGLKISPTEYVGNVLRVTQFEQKRDLKKLGKPIDRNEWFMYPQTVNAYYASMMNEIVFPAAILQFPFFDLAADDALNYGSIGMTIGHEITHGFDDEGSKFDGKGNMKSWWTDEDRKQFDARAKVLEKQFDAYVVDGGLHVNGKLTLGENIADLGGLSIAYNAYQLNLERHGRKDIDGLTPEQRFFLGYAQAERENARPEFTKMLVLTNPHAPSYLRVNGPFSNMPEFYKAFGVKKGDKLFRPSGKIARIW